jgi:hypothetical protein
MMSGAPCWKYWLVELVACCPVVFLAPERQCAWGQGRFFRRPPPCFALLAAKSFLCGGHCGWASLPPASAYELWLTGKGTEPTNRRCPVPSNRIGPLLAFLSHRIICMHTDANCSLHLGVFQGIEFTGKQ